jgi:hypothetical protein
MQKEEVLAEKAPANQWCRTLASLGCAFHGIDAKTGILIATVVL